MQGCMTDKQPDFTNKDEVYMKIRGCLCMLDQFQDNYTNQEFMELFAGAHNNQQSEAQELMSFVKEKIGNCL